MSQQAQPGRVFSYCRVSTRAQDREGADGLQRQEQMAREWCQAHGRELDPLDLTDVGLSAFRGRNLAAGALGRFLDMARRGELGPAPWLLIEDLDRFSRSGPLDVIQALITDVAQVGVTLVVLRDGLTVSRTTLQDDPATWYRLIAAVQAAHDYSRRLSERVRSARRAEQDAIRRGEPKRTGRLPFWIRWNPDAPGGDGTVGAFELDPEWAPVVVDMFDRCIDGDQGGARIAAALNDDGIRTRQGARWSVRSVINVLQSPACIGLYQPCRRTYVETTEHGRTTRRRVDVPVGEPIARYPAVVEPGRFALAQERIKRRTQKGGPRTLFRCPFQGLLRCGRCGAMLTVTSSRRATRSYDYLRCQGAIQGRRDCDAPPLRHLDVVAAVLTGLGEVSWAGFFPGDGSGELEQARTQLMELRQGLEAMQARHRTLVERVTEAAVDGAAMSLLKTLQDAADLAQQEIDDRLASVRRAEGHLSELERRPGPDDLTQELRERVAGVMVHFGRGDDTAQERMELNDLFTRAGITVVVDQDVPRVGYRLHGVGPEWVPIDWDSAVVRLATGTIDPARFPSVVAEHRAAAADALAAVEQARAQRVAAALAAGKDPQRTTLSGRELNDDQAAAGLEWLRSRMAVIGSYDLAGEAQAVRERVSRRKATRDEDDPMP
jgi:DNA invertase Pin-like site-specific DNA recombinase